MTSCFFSLTVRAADKEAVRLMRPDAELADVCFVDSQFGWAVGDRGTVWHTEDGGGSWQQQTTNVRCRLNSVQFLDRKRGWAAGGWTQSYTHLSQGVLLRTKDGGRTWQSLRSPLIPLVKKIKFFDSRHGVALGKPAALFPSGVFTTDDGGRSWMAAPGESNVHWLAADFVDPHTGVLAARGGAAAQLKRRAIVGSDAEQRNLRSVRQIKMQTELKGYAVGDGGLVLATNDLGRTWQTVASPLPKQAGKYFDLHAVAAQGSHLWVAGTPGTRLFYSPDQGRTWQMQQTGVRTPIESIEFIDARHGWAVGALGTILATVDGGRTWHRQRSGGTRAALVGFFSDPEKAPLELVAKLSGSDGYLSVVDIVARRDFDPQANCAGDLSDRLHEAVVEVGGCRADVSWRFPLRQQGLRFSVDRMIADLNRASDGHALEELERFVVREIRLWQPDVLVTESASLYGKHPLSHLINQIVLHAAEKASRPTEHVEMTAIAGLQPWRVRKIFSVVEDNGSGVIELDTARLEQRLQRSIADLAMTARGVLQKEFQTVPQQIGFRILASHGIREEDKSDFFRGIALSPGGDARRMLREPPQTSIENLSRIARTRRNMQAIIEHSEKTKGLNQAWLGQVGTLTGSLDPASACQILYQVAQQFVRSGEWELAAGTFEMLAERHPRHPLAQTSQVWLLQYYGSAETAWRVGRGNKINSGTQRIVPAAPQPRISPPRDKSRVQRAAAEQEPEGNALPEIVPTSATTISQQQTDKALGSRDRIQDSRLEKAIAYAKHLERTEPTLYAEPGVAFSIATAQRRYGYASEASRIFMAQSRRRRNDPWWSAAQGEIWLARKAGDSPKRLWKVVRAGEKPYLDGKFADPIWKHAPQAVMRSQLGEDAAWNASARMAYDSHYLYLAIQCNKVEKVAYPPTLRPRPRDPDLTAQDRVDLLLDIDRDYATYYRLTIDHRGCIAESCWHDRSWNPRCFVASDATDKLWTAEIAIPLAELTGDVPTTNHVWAVGLQRTIPGAGFQSWTEAASTEIQPEGFGYLVFE